MVKLSNSRLNTYEECPKKYYFKYVEKLRTETIYSSLHLGSALDTTFNKLLLHTKDNLPITLDELYATFTDAFTYYAWDKEGNDREDVRTRINNHYYKKEFNPLSLMADQVMLVHDLFDVAPEVVTWENNRPAHNLIAWCSNYNLGKACVLTYYEDTLPELLKEYEIISIQEELKVTNDDGDIFTAILDFTAKHKATGNLCVMDNKSASTSSMKKDYKPDAVKKSQQLSLYATFKGWQHAGYVVYQKEMLSNGKVLYKIICDEVSEDTVDEVFSRHERLLDEIKSEIYDKNNKSCFSFGKPCEYTKYCKYNNPVGLFREEKKEDT